MTVLLQDYALPLSRSDLFIEAAYVGGKWATDTDRMEVTNPATGELIGTVPNFGAKQTSLAVDAATAAQKPWAALTAGYRGAVLREWARLVLEHARDLATIMTAEQGKPIAEARGEVVYAASFLEWFAEEARRIDGEVIQPHASDRRLLVRKEPVGVVAAITPWNFPLAMITRKAGPALAAGCTIVIKPSELTPFSALALAKLGEEAGIPAGVLNVVTGDAAQIGDVLTGDPRIRKFTFTGSTSIGKMLAARCMDTVKRVSLELGGNAPFIVFDDADIDAAVDGAIAAKFRNSGQTCVCTNRFIVQEGIYDEFANRLSERVGKLVVGPGLDGRSDQGPLIDQRAVARVSAHVEDAVGRGATLMTGGTTVCGPGTFFSPTVLRDVPADALLCREETFGPVAGLLKFRDEAEAIAMANDTRSGLASYLFTRDLDRSIRMTEALEYGMVGLNTGVISTEVAPFGGIKESGLGREGSRHGIDDYVELKLVCTAIKTTP
ncbi:NAD-dependent succinate-semialdehyde dehydrogenase [Croceicoccus bisphenolivorans]|uniref:NAD-dependent succinate-semialdehyde dehydrogenase n=1 Tax=Croceicoccus bisphenolivorans TaxID=1783232 RepID=UPI00082B1BCA|nr:NAD-dependent succinate-semialdehyde dehydrogenase [Croceicoccus bisphenolivorans]